MIPTAPELDAWLETLRGGYASKEMLPRMVEGYKRLLKVVEAARDVDLYCHHSGDGEQMKRFLWLHQALDALEAPVPEMEKK